MSKTGIEPDNFPFFDYKRYTFCLGLDTKEGVWLSGHSASEYDPDLKRVVANGDIVEQSRTAYKKIGIILAAAGLGFGDVVRTVDYVTVNGIEDYPKTAQVRSEIFGDIHPATSTVVVNRLLRSEALIEIEVIASRKNHSSVDPGWNDASFSRSIAKKVGDLLYISAQLPINPTTNSISGEGDIVAQANAIYENTEKILKTAGMGWENVVKTVDFLTPDGLSGYRETGYVRKEYLGKGYPVSTGIIMQRLAHPKALLQVDFVAVSGKREVFNPGWSRYDKLTYVPSIKVGNLLFLAGHGSLNPETQKIEHEGDIVSQTRYIYSNLNKVLAAAGATSDSVVKTIEFVTPEGLAGYRDTASVRKEFFTPPYPSATGVVCDRLLRPEMLIEVDAMAILG